MSDTVVDPGIEAVLTRLDSTVDELLTLPLDGVTDADLLTLWQRLETVRRRLPVADHAIITQLKSRHLDYTYGAKNLAALARQVLRVGVGEAAARVRSAEAAGPRMALSGEPLAPVFEKVAAAQATGAISPDHARTVVSMIGQLPYRVSAELGDTLEQMLVEQARVLDATQLAQHAHDLAAVLNPDGAHCDAVHRDRVREFRIRHRPDGSCTGSFETTAELGEHLRTVFDSLARPKPEADGIKDQRSYPQRCHDALLDLVLIAERSQQLPDSGGVTTTIILTFDAEDYAHNTGTARTGHGVTLATADAKKWAGDARIIGVVLDTMRAVTAYSTTHRIFTENQRLAMAARDGGCAFPGCDTPPQQCEAHHMIESQDGGPTSTDNGCLLCSYHHREFEPLGWTGEMLDGIPHFVPPRWLDREQKPRRNTIHDRVTEPLPV